MGKKYNEKSIKEVVIKGELVSIKGKMIVDLTVNKWRNGGGENLIFILNDGVCNLKCIIFINYKDIQENSIQKIKADFVKGHFLVLLFCLILKKYFIFDVKMIQYQ